MLRPTSRAVRLGSGHGSAKATHRAADEQGKEKRPLSLGIVWNEAKEVIWDKRGRISVGFGLMLVSRAAGMVLPASSKYLIDEVVGNGRLELLTPLALAAGAATLVQAATGFGLSQILGVAAQRAIAEMRRNVHRHILRLPVSYFDSVKSGELISRVMTDAEGIRNLVGTGLVQLAGSLVTAVAAFAILLYLNWSLTLLTLLFLVTFGGMMAFAFSRLRPLFRKRGELYANTTGRLGEALGGVRIVKSYTAEQREEDIFQENIGVLLGNIIKTLTGVAGVSALSTAIFGGVGVIMIVFGGRAIVSGAMTLGDFVMYIFFTGLLAAPLVQIASISTQLSEAFAGLDRIREIRSMVTEDDQDASRHRIERIHGDIAFEDVHFSYDEGVPVLQGIDFLARAGTTTALVGSSGSGKSTLISLVLAFNRPDLGRILVDGTDLRDVRLRDYRSFVGVVMQENFLFDGTIEENIRYSRPEASRDEIERASRIANCHDFVTDFENGYETVVGERGVKLSGGQRQRIAIARAVLADPRILILDEATSSLDSESERKIQDGLSSLRQGRTSFVIAHRLSTIRSADTILVLERGRIVERGTHAELLANNGRYRDLYEQQYALETDRYVNPGEDFTPEPEREKVKAPNPRQL